MAASVRPSSKAPALALCVLAAACTEELDPIEGTTSLAIELVTPADPGSFEERLDDAAREVTLQVRALDAQGEVDASFEGEVGVYSHFLGSLTPELGDADGPLATLTLTAGESASTTLGLPPVFGPSFLWIEDAADEGSTFATGTSPTLWFRDPYLADCSRPADEAALDALEASPLEKKQINVTASRYGEVGRMVVTGIYAQGYTLADVACQDADGTPPCTTDAYDSIFVFSFSRPEDEEGRALAIGDTIGRLTGSIGEFNGLTEVNFPQSFRVDDADPERVPAPVDIEPSWLSTAIEMERVEAALVAVTGTVCPLDDDFDTYSQWKIDVGGGCPTPGDDLAGELVNVITKGQVNELVPADHVGQTVRVVGTLRPVNVNGGSFNVWILYPRSIDDIEIQE
jgi:hypothetical protein